MKTLPLLLINILTGCCIITGCSKKGTNVEGPSLTASIEDVTEERKTSSSVFRFIVTLNKPASSTVTMQYTTVPGTALSTTDFIPASGTLTFNSSEQQKTIEVTVTGDSLRKGDQLFTVQLSNAQNSTLEKSSATGTIVNKNGLYFPVNNAGYSTPLTYPGYTLAWADEFTNKVIDPGSWTFESGNNNGWGNNELQSYTDRPQNVFVSQGNLILEARAELYNSFNYTSTRMITKNKKMFKFGRIDIRTKLPVGKGIWPALWMLGKNIDQVSWPTCGEIDIMEYLGHEPFKVHGTVHWGQNFATRKSLTASYTSTTKSYDEQFNVYSLIWNATEIKILVNDILYFTAPASSITAPNPFNNEFFLIFNIAVGGNWPGSPDATTIFPQRMVVDYVRVFQ